MAESNEIVRQLIGTVGATGELAGRIRHALTPDPDAVSSDERDLVAALRNSRESALSVLLGVLTPERVASYLDGDDSRRHVIAVLNTPHPRRAPVTEEFVHSLQARLQHHEECIRLLAAALVEVLHPSPRTVDSMSHGTAPRRVR